MTVFIIIIISAMYGSREHGMTLSLCVDRLSVKPLFDPSVYLSTSQSVNQSIRQSGNFTICSTTSTIENKRICEL